MFRLLTKLTTLRLLAGGQEERLTDQQVARVAESFGETKGITFKALRKLLELDNRTRFVGISDKDKSRHRRAQRQHRGRNLDTAQRCRTVRMADVDAQSSVRDRIADVLTFREDPASIRQGMIDAGLEEPLLSAVMDGVEKGEFGQFSKAGHISAKAARALMPPLLRGCRYDEACKELGWDHAERNEVRLADVRNPVARKAVTEILKQVRAIIEAHGLPIHPRRTWRRPRPPAPDHVVVGDAERLRSAKTCLACVVGAVDRVAARPRRGRRPRAGSPPASC